MTNVKIIEEFQDIISEVSQYSKIKAQFGCKSDYAYIHTLFVCKSAEICFFYIYSVHKETKNVYFRL